MTIGRYQAFSRIDILRFMEIIMPVPEVVPDLTIMQPYVQWGFAGFCFVVFATLTTINVWLMKNYISVVRENNKVIYGNTSAISSIHVTADETRHLMSDIRDQLLSRPCLMDAARQREVAQQSALKRVADKAAEALDHVAADAADALRLKEGRRTK